MTSDLHQQHQQHRRLNSTPIANAGSPKVPFIPATTQQDTAIHRRGLSLDQGPRVEDHLLNQFPQEKNTAVTNPGYNQQHILREAQQQRLARPGHFETNQTAYPMELYQTYKAPRQIQPAPRKTVQQTSFREEHDGSNFVDFGSLGTSDLFKKGNDTNCNMLTSIEQCFPTGGLEGFNQKFDDIDKFLQLDGEGDENKRSRYFGADEQMSPKAHGKNFPQRPRTPLSQSTIGHTPMTPKTTPFSKGMDVQRRSFCQTTQCSPTWRDPNETIKASLTPMKRGRSCQDVFQHENDEAIYPSPPNTVPMKSSHTFDVAAAPPPSFMNMLALKMDFAANESGYNSSHYSPMSKDISPAMSSQVSTPEMEHMDLFGEVANGMPNFAATSQRAKLVTPKGSVDLGTRSPVAKPEMLSRTQSFSEIALDSSIDATIEDTGITSDEIASFIQGPDPIDSRWVCMFPECNKKFGRKENIKSHVQTHLNDRQFKCNHCEKKFVRQHDLKRHSKIHSGVKPYPCACGNSFARHDALTRHRQRGMCIGAFEGCFKKEIKRGRPKKAQRPDNDERREKAAATRQRVLERTYASSMSGSSVCSYPSPEAEFVDTDMNMRGTSPFDNLPTLEPASDMFSYTPPESPGNSTGNCISPQQFNLFSPQYHTPCASQTPSPVRGPITDIPEVDEEQLPPLMSPTKSATSQYGTPPELDLSSSSPAASKFFDFDQSSESTGNVTQSTSTNPSTDVTDNFKFSDLGMSQENVDKMFSDCFGDNDTTSLERDPTLLMDKFEENFVAGDAMCNEYSSPFFDD